MRATPYQKSYFKKRQKFLIILFIVSVTGIILLFIWLNSDGLNRQPTVPQTEKPSVGKARIPTPPTGKRTFLTQAEKSLFQQEHEDEVEEDQQSQLEEESSPVKPSTNNTQAEAQDRRDREYRGKLSEFRDIINEIVELDLKNAQATCISFTQTCLAIDCSDIEGEQWSPSFWIKVFKGLRDDIKKSYYTRAAMHLLTPNCKWRLKDLITTLEPIGEKVSQQRDLARKMELLPGDVRHIFDTFKIDLVSLGELNHILAEIKRERYFFGVMD